MTESPGAIIRHLPRPHEIHVDRQPLLAPLAGLAILLMNLLVACSGSAPSAATSTPVPSRNTATASEAGLVQVVSSPESPTLPNVIRLEFAEGTEAAYLVNEQLACLDLPNDAIGTTDAVSGLILLGDNNRIPAEGSDLRVDLRTLTSDSDRRDRYVRRNTLSTSVYPFVVFIPREVPRLPSPLPTEGEASFPMVGDMTIQG